MNWLTTYWKLSRSKVEEIVGGKSRKYFSSHFTSMKSLNIVTNQQLTATLPMKTWLNEIMFSNPSFLSVKKFRLNFPRLADQQSIWHSTNWELTVLLVQLNLPELNWVHSIHLLSFASMSANNSSQLVILFREEKQLANKKIFLLLLTILSFLSSNSVEISFFSLFFLTIRRDFIMHKEGGNENLQKIKSPLGSVCGGVVEWEFHRRSSCTSSLNGPQE